MPALGRTMPMMHFISVDLAVAVGAEQHHGLAAADLERDVLDHAHRAVGGVNAG